MLAIGKITKPQGLKGEMKILPFGDACLFGVSSVFVCGKEYEIEYASQRPNGMFVKFKGFDTIESIQNLKHKDIEIPIEKAREIVGNEKFLWQDAFDSKIILKDGNKTEEFGVVSDIDNYGSADIVFACDISGKNFSFPIVHGLVLKISDKQLVLDKKRFLEVVCYED